MYLCGMQKKIRIKKGIREISVAARRGCEYEK